MKKTKKLWIFLGILLIINLFVYLTHFGGKTILLYTADLLPVLCSCIAVVSLFFCVKSFKDFDTTKVAWLLILLGVILYFLAESTFAALELVFLIDVNNTYPTLADYFWCAGYIPVFMGLMLMYTGYKKSGLLMKNIKLYGFLSVLILALFSLVIYYLLIPILKDTETSGLGKFLYLFYPIGDLFIVTPAVILMYITSLFGKGSLSIPWKLLALGFILFTISDLIYSYIDWQGAYETGNMIDLGWNAGYLLIGLSGLYQTEIMESLN
jgi:hypothetical protein